ncbi:PIN domain-containing protein, partial [Acinetobacter baumannii]
MLDTNIAIELRDNAEGFADRLAALNARPALSAISLVELEGGVAAIPDLSRLRRARLDIILATFEIIDFTHAMA